MITGKIPRDFLARGSADAILTLLQCICVQHIGEAEREHVTTNAVKWFINLADHMGVEKVQVSCEFKNLENGTAQCVYTAGNAAAARVKDYLLERELSRELEKG